MTVDQLREVHQARPFRPFRLQLADGNEVHVQHPELMLIAPSGRTAVIAISEDAFKIVDVLLVASIEVGDRKPRRPRKTRGN